jgi:hypothetical protein
MVPGGVRKSVNIPDAVSAGTTIAGFAGQALSIAQLQKLLGIIVPPSNTQTPTGAVIPGSMSISTSAVSGIIEDALEGEMGPPGPQGPAGPTGPRGAMSFFLAEDGVDGDPGPPGVVGAAGTAGPAGPTGATGAQGTPGAALFFLAEDGVDGDPGAPGATGARGLQGVMGVVGMPGEDGVDGDPGPPGATGATGAAGAAGAAGATGAQGTPGAALFILAEDGMDGDPGIPGATGAKGATGAMGPPAFLLDDGVVDDPIFVASFPGYGVNYPWSGQHTFSGTIGRSTTTTEMSIGIDSGFPAIAWSNASGGTDSKLWEVYANTTQLIFQTVNDAQTVGSAFLIVNRSGNTPTLITLVYPTTFANSATVDTSGAIALTINSAVGLNNNALYINSANTGLQYGGDILMTRASSVANNVQAGANITFGDTGSSYYASLQSSGGQFEFWQYNAGWGQTMFLGVGGDVTVNNRLNCGNVGGLGRLNVNATASAVYTSGSWDNTWAMFGPSNGSGSGAALGLGYNGAGAHIVSLSPGIAWEPLTLHATSLTLNCSGGGVTGAGTLVTNGSGVVSVSSDRSIKRDIHSFMRGLEAVLELRPVTHGYTKESGLDDGGRYAGFIAQDVYEAIPEAVGRGGDGLLTLSDRPILAAVVNAVHALNTRLERLE